MNKTTSGVSAVRKIMFFLMVLLVSVNSYSQTPKFTTPVLKSGTDKQVGAKYLYSNVTIVDGTNVDAIVTIVSISNATIVDVDNPTNGGLIDRFQPVVNTTRANGYVEFEFSFYKSGTYGTTQELRIDLGSFILEALDLDGNEFFDVARPNNETYTLEANTFITVSTVAPYTRFQGPSNSVDPISITNTQYIVAVNFGTLNAIKFRLGNSGISSNRQSSISFGEVSFIVPKAPIANNDSSLCKPYGSVSLDVTINDTDSNQNIDKSTVDLNQSLSGVQNSLVVSGEGTWSVNSVGVVTFSPLVTFKGNPTPIFYTINDLTALTSNQAKITITYTPNAPTITVVETCNGTSTLTASNYTGTLLWSTGATTSSITVSTSGTYTLSQTVSGCSATSTVSITQAAVINFGTPTVTNVGCFGENTGKIVVGTTGGTGTITYTISPNVGTQVSSGTFNNLTAQSYLITATDTKGCTQTQSVSITQPAAALSASATGTNVNCFGQSTGSMSVSASGGTLSYSYVIAGPTVNSTGATSGNFTGLSAGAYTVTVTDSKSCSTTATYTVTQPAAALSASATGTNVNCFGQSTGSMSVSASGGTLSYSYVIAGPTVNSTGATSGNFTGLSAGAYTVTVTDSKGCSTTATYAVTQPAAALSASATGTNVNCFGQSTGSMSVSASGGTLSYSYVIAGPTVNSTGATSGNFTGLSAGAYTVTVTDSKSCSTTATYTVTQPAAALSASATGTNVNCFGQSTGSMSVSASGGTLSYSYVIAGPTVNTTGATSGNFTGLSAGAYTVTVTDSKGCSTTATYAVTQPAAALSASATGTNVNCFGQSTGSMSVSASGGTLSYSYVIAGPTVNTTGATSGIFTGLSSGAYTVTVTDSKGCTTTATYTVTQPAAALSASATGTNVNCFGQSTGSMSVSASGGTLSYSYVIAGPTVNTTGATSGIFTGLSSGAYTVTVTDSKGCTTTATYTVTQPAAALSASATGTNVNCFGQSTGSMSVSASGGTPSYSYVIAGPTVNTTGATSGNFTGLSAGAYTVTVTDSKSCSTTATYTVTQPAAALTSSISSQTNVDCFGNSIGSVTVAGANGTSPYTYAKDGVTFVSSGTFGSLAVGSYTITVKDANGCTKTQAVTITQPAAALTSSISSQTNVDCFGNSTGSVTVAGANGTSPYTYAKDGATFVSSGTFGSLAVGSYTITVKDANGCTKTQAVTITQPAAALTSSISSQTNVDCFGNSTGSVTVAGANGTSPYTYAKDGATFVSSGTFGSLAVGSYTITVKDANGCTKTQAVTITQPAAALTSSISSQTNVDCFGNSTGSVTVAGANGTSPYTYAKDGVTFVSSGTFGSLAVGSYTITVKDANGCTKTQAVTITQPAAALTSSISSQTNVDCFGNSTGSVTVAGANGTSPYTYAKDGVTFVSSGTFGSLAVGSYTITVKDANGCTKTQAVTITQPAASLTSSISSQTNVDCFGNSTGSVTVAGANGTSPYTYAKDGATFVSSGTFGSLAVGSYTITVKDANGCTKTQAVTITQPAAALTSSISSQTNVDCFGNSTGSVTVAGANGTSPYTYAKDGVTFVSSGTFGSLAVGSYTITVKDANGCTKTQAVTITQPAAALTSSISSQTNVDCFGNSTGSVTVAGANGTSPYTYAKDGVTFVSSGTFGSLAVGSFTITVKDANGCTKTQAVTITQPAASLTSSISSQTNVDCFGNSTGSVTVAGANGTSPYTYAKDGVTFVSSGTFGSLAVGSYTITVKDANGCTKTQAVTITQPAAISVNNIILDASCRLSNNGSIDITVSGGTGPYTFLWSNGSIAEDIANLYLGNYTVKITDSNNCTLTKNYTVGAGICPIDAINDGPTTVQTGATATTIGNVTANDTLNGVLVTAANTDVTPITAGPLSINSEGVLTLAPNTTTGTYTITYQLCEVGATPSNCDTATATVVVSNPIDAKDDTYTQTPGTTDPTTVGTVTANDTLNGVLVTAANTDVTPITAGPLSINSEGVLTLAPNTTTGTYTITYQLCEVGATPSNCDTATATVVVSNPIDAKDDTYTQTPGTTDPTTVGTVTANDTLNGVLVTAANTDVTPITAGPLSINSEGVLTLAPNTTTGTYTITYQLCEVGATPSNCDTATATVVVSNPIDAKDDTYTQTPGTTDPTTVGTVTANDTLNGVLVTAANTDVTPITAGPLSINSEGVLTLAPNTTTGTYTITYQLCEVGATPSNCDTATATVVVSNPIDAKDDTYTQTPGTTDPTTVGTVTANDTLNGVLVTAANTDVTPITAGPLSINSEGVLTLAPNTTTGTYTITYQLCEVGATPSNCDTATATVVVSNPIDAKDDTYTQTPGTTDPTTVGTVTANDTLNGVLVTAANTDVTPITAGPLSINSEGVLTLAPNTTTGTYTITYQLCEVGATPSNCDTATATVVVSNPIDAKDDTYTQTPGTTDPTTVGTVTANDTLNGVLVTAANTDVTPITAGPLSINSEGVLTLAPNTTTGTYTITYQLCEVGATPSNCDTATATVVVSNPIDAKDDTYTQTPGTTDPTTVGTVTANDTLNGVLVTAANTDVTPITAGPLSINSEGVLTLAPNTTTGTYTITYQLCEVGATPSNCDTATATVVVSNPIDAKDDTYTQTPGTTDPTTVGTVTANDTLNGVLVTAANTDVTPITAGPLSINSEGVLTLAPNTTTGTYTITYQLCEVGATPSNCDTATATVVVSNPIDAKDDTYTQTPGTTDPTTVGTVTANDTLNGVLVTAANTDVTPITAGPLSINSEGVLTLAPNTTTGTYTITYQLCEVGATPSNCDTATATVVVSNPIDAKDDTYTQTPGTTDPTTVGTVTANDTLNGVLVTAANTDVTPITAGPLSINSEGVLTLAPNTTTGTYTITYQLCEVGATPSNCDTATATVVVSNPIDAKDDTYTQTPGTTDPTTVGTVTANDTLNGVLVTAANTDVTPITAGPLSINSEGVLTLAPNTTTGTYTITYQLCEVGATPSNCDTATATVVVSNPIDAKDDTYTQTPGTTDPTTVGTVTANDTLNGVLVTAANTDVTPITAGPLSINSEGVLTLAPNTTTGTYTITYQLCEVGATPSNCDTATATVVVSNPIDAKDDTYTQTPGTTDPTTVGTVTANDTLNGVLVTAANTDVTPITAGPLSINSEGVLTLAPNTTTGTYTITYQLCEVGATPSNCDTATATVVVSNPIDAKDDTYTQTPGTTDPTTVGTVTANDTLNGVLVTAANTDVTPITAGPLSINSEGVLTLAPNTTTGTYTITYQLCEVGATPSNCDTATATVVVSNPIDAKDDTYTQTPGTTDPTTVGTVTANDTLNGVAVTAANTDVTPITAGPLSINSEGVLTLAPNTTTGTYTITYQLCEVGATPSNCDTATATVVVSNPIDAKDDTYTQTPGTTDPTTVGTVTANDTLNGVLVTAANTDVTPITAGPLSINSEGVLTLAPNTTTGTYTITYQLCEVGATPSNCDTATATVVVSNPIDAKDDTYTQTPGTTDPTTVGTVTANDTLNGVLVTAANTDVTPITAGPLSINSEGVLTLAPNTTTGTYTITYQLCEVGATPSNCDTATATVVVSNPIDAKDDTYTQTPGTTDPTTVGTVTANDTLNGVLVTAANTDVTPITAGPLSINSEGVLTLAPNTTTGTYTITYQLCEVGATPSNCDTATATVVVSNPIDAKDDTYTQTPGTTDPTTVGTVTANDTLNGVLVTAANTDVTPITAGPLSINSEGVLTLAPNTTTGTYTITYQLCEVGATPSNCDTATATVVVSNPIDAKDDTYTQTPGTTDPTTVGTVTANDTLNGVLVTAANTDVTPITAGPLSINSEGVLTLAPNTTTGTYTITYQLCEVGATPSNCDTATATVVVSNPIDAKDDTYTQTPGTTDPTTVGTVTANDTLNGVLVTAANTDVTPITAGPLSINSEGVLTLAPNTTTGTYTITYQLCEVGATPSNCDTATATVVVSNPIDAKDDTYTQTPGTTDPTTVGTVTANDTLNGVLVTAANTDVTPITAGPLSINSEGVLTLAPNTTTGTYTITYQLCEVGATPSNCDTATATVVVSNPIDAKDDTYTQTPGTTDPTTVGTVTANDTLNGVLVTAANTDVTPITAGPLSINSEGVLTLAPNTTTGTYTITYQLCEVGATPSNCDTATATVVVSNPIDAKDDTYTQTPGTTDPTTVGTVTANDTLNGVLVTAANTDVTPITAGPLSINSEGVLTLAPNTTTGTYTITYQLCEVGATPSNCDTATATVVVSNPIDAKDDTYTQTPGTTDPTTVGTVTANDTLNGVLVTAANTDVTPITAGPLSINSEGVLTLAPNTTTGTYTITYQLCEVGATPSNCDTATATVVVSNPIDAKDDTYTQTPGTTDPTTVGTVTANDTLNGVLVTAANTDVTPITAGPLSINSEGVLTLAPNTTTGTYTITYQLCEVGATPSNCDTATATVVVSNPIDAKDDTYTQTPGTTDPTTVGTVTANDTLNGVLVTAANTDVTPITAGPLSINSEGVLTLAPNTTTGTYTITYQLCEVGATPSNCDTATATVVVSNPIDAKDDTYTQTPGTTDPTTVGTVTANDTLNGVLVTAANTDVTPITAGPLSINSEGVLTLAPNTTTGTYTITYQLCEVGATPSNCDTATATVVVSNPIDAKDDTYTQTPGTTDPTTVGTVTANDTLNGVLVTAANTDVTPITAGPLSINSEGVLTLAPNTTTGTYTITYQLCEVGATPSNCDTATATVVVSNPIDAKDDTYTQTPGTTDPTTVGTVTANDTLNGVLVTAANTDVTPITAGPLSINSEGVLTLAPNTTTGTYTITYQLCEVGATPSNCDTATATVVVSNPIDAKDDTYTQTPGTTDPTTVGTVTANDTLNGVLVTAANTDVTPITAGPLSINSEGVLTLAPNTTTGTYTITYQLCEVGATPSNCDTATATVVVSNPIDAKDDTYTQTPGTTDPTTVGTVTANDTLNGVLVTAANTDVTPITAGPLSINSEGVLTLAPNTTTGTYTITYQLCEVGATPSNCDTATATVVVSNVIDAKDDTTYPVAVQVPAAITTIGNVTANDTLNGVAVTAANTDVTPITAGPLSIDANGVLTLAANTTTGTYTITYQLCEVGANPSNCDTATATVVVSNVIDAKDDTTYPVAVQVPAAITTIGNVTANDTLNGVAVTAANTDVTPITAGPLSIDANGVLTLAANTTTGTYTITYQLCEVGANPSNCDTATATVVVSNVIDAKDDTTYPVAVQVPAAITTIGNVTANDTLNGVLVTAANTDVTPITAGPLSINSEGVLTLAPNTTTGTYTITYQLCEVGATPSNCDTATATVVVSNPIDAKDDTYTQTPGTTDPTTVGTVTANDTLNGVLVTAANTDVTPITAGPLSINSEGVLTLAPNTTTGTYTITYQLCEVGATPSNCDTATATVVVSNPIDAKDDTTYPVAVQVPAAITTIGNVTANDTLNGVAVTAANTDVTPITAGPLSIDANGVLTLAANTTTGTYTITYQLCEVGATPSNCDTATATVVVSNVIDAKDDTTYLVAVQVPAAITTIGNVTANDTLNGVAVTAANTDVTPITAGPLSIDANGVLTLAPNTTTGTYTITYQLCEVGATPSNCDTATATVVVSNPIDAKDDTYTQTPGTTDPTTVGTVTANDTLNGVLVTAANTDVTPITAGPLSIDANGLLTLAPNTTTGTYTITYQLCEVGATPSNCDTATATVVVSNVIDAKDDTTYPVAVQVPAVITTIGNVTANDTLNGVAVTAANTDVTPITAGPLSIDANGVLTLAANTISGTYSIIYQLCEVGANPSNCDTATATVVVSNVIDAINDGPTTVQTGATVTTVGNVTINDTLNGVAVTAANTDVTPITAGPLSIDSEGVLTLAANTVSGTYTITYQLCEVGANPSNCDTATATVIVAAPPIDAVSDVVGPINGTTGGTLPSVLTNDTLNGVPVNLSNVLLTSTPTGPLTVNPNGTVTVAPNTPAGTYTINYTICEILNPNNCDTATVTVTVVAASIDAVSDVGGPINGTTGGTLPSVLTNDTLNGVPVNLSNVLLTSTPTGPLTVSPNGTVTVAPNTPAGTYTINYTICEILNPNNCDTATVTVTVVAAPIDAVSDVGGPINGTTGGTLPSVLTNDTLNGVPVNLSNVLLTSTPTGPLTVNPNGTVTVAPNTPAGTYTINYTICEILNPNNCDTATVTVTVVAAPIDAVSDVLGPINGTTGGTLPSVLTNDTLNGVPVNLSNVLLTSTPTGPLTVNPNGTVTVAPNTPAGTYTINYTICEILNPNNCDTATVTVTVVAAPIDAVSDVGGPINGTTGGTLPSVLLNDTLNGVPVNLSNVLLTSTPTGPLTVNPNGTVTVAPNTPAGTYTINYTICEILNPNNCDTATVTVTVVVVTPALPSISIIKTAVFNDSNNDGFAQVGETITYSFLITNTGNVALSNVTVIDNLQGLILTGTPIVSLGAGQTNNTAYSGVYPVTLSDIQLGLVVNNASVTGSTLNGTIVRDDTKVETKLEEEPIVLPEINCVIEVYNAVSPNGDGSNDFFRIEGLDCYPDNRVEIYNRWGVLVFERDGYNNADKSFKGISEGRVTISQSEGLPTGTYYYILKYKDTVGKGQEKAGYLYLNR